ncbi:Holliday junction branch migration protein RuvA [Hankyongella ginsenosidimutans]|uniref:Holliday junction branch migration complex subunit RuvA n=1 Tax=Hankyongella ginsenosidimutans TaxID=1763828 RepID=A0A4D7C9V0_9SPHN|nr:Holliday junction branch migration protein RuvA [Hankyongella ginsenosidimutans]QCI79813.1 Holliday junction branch migration protein RuvA [Hankyongella ginsenosidimutans]
MFAKLTGTVDALLEEALVLDVQDVGYLVAVSVRTLAQLAPGERVRLFIETQVREDAITLYGFPSADEQRWFRLLQSVQGVGGRVALGVLSVLAPNDLAQAIATQDKASVARASGVGPKLAQRIVNELKDKAPLPSGVSLGAVMAASVPVAGTTDDAVSALLNLGFKQAEAARAVAAARKALDDDAPLDRVIPAALKELTR